MFPGLRRERSLNVALMSRNSATVEVNSKSVDSIHNSMHARCLLSENLRKTLRETSSSRGRSPPMEGRNWLPMDGPRNPNPEDSGHRICSMLRARLTIPRAVPLRHTKASATLDFRRAKNLQLGRFIQDRNPSILRCK